MMHMDQSYQHIKYDEYQHMFVMPNVESGQDMLIRQVLNLYRDVERREKRGKLGAKSQEPRESCVRKRIL